jgi:hypothetical protein
MVQRGHLDVPVIGVARTGRMNEHLKSACATASSSKAATPIKM